MTTKSKAMTKEPVARCPPPQEQQKHNPQLKHLAGSNYDDWNTLVANQVMQSGWYPSKMDAEQRQKMHFGFLCFMSGVEPKDQIRRFADKPVAGLAQRCDGVLSEGNASRANI